MRSIFIFFFLLPGIVHLSAQNVVSAALAKSKPVIDSAAIANWPVLNSGLIISNDGNYLFYSMQGSQAGTKNFILQSMAGTWRQDYVGISGGFFSADSKLFVFQRKDSLYFVRLGTVQQTGIAHVGSFSHPRDDGGRWLAYLLKGANPELVLVNLADGKERHYPGVTGYSFDERGNSLLLKTESHRDSSTVPSLTWVNLVNKTETMIWPAEGTASRKATVAGWSFDAAGNQVVFTVEEQASGLPGKSSPGFTNVWYYRYGMTTAEQRVSSQSSGMEPGTTVKGVPRFSANGRWLLFDVQFPLVIDKPRPGVAQVSVWSYKDLLLQPEQTRRLQRKEPKTFAAAVSVQGGAVVRLQQDGEIIKGGTPQAGEAGDYCIVGGLSIDPWWQFAIRPSVYLERVADGSRHLLQNESDDVGNFSFSPTGRWLAYYNRKKATWCGINMLRENVRTVTPAIEITRNVPVSFQSEYGNSTVHDSVDSVAGWVSGDAGVLLYDNYDIWQVDPSGQRAAINVTNGYGKKHHLKLRLVYGPDKYRSGGYYAMGDTLLLSAFSPQTKYNGFYRKVLGQPGDPELLCLGPYIFDLVASQKSGGATFMTEGKPPVKARDVNVWVLQRQSATEFPNYFVTTDFKSFKPLTDLHPEQQYNWLRSELISWKMFDGQMSQGVLYKPENFDPAKKYPLIFNYYEQLSHRLYEFAPPGYTEENINIPWFVSRGYLVFTPDIHFKPANVSGKTSGEWAYNAVVSAAAFLSKLPYVDGKRMGIQGHSFGGGETNYLVTHSRMFAAAAEVAGDSDPLSAYLTLIPLSATIEYASKQTSTEIGQGQYGASPWERPDLYRRNSAVLSADKVTAPLLIVHNERDNSIQWRQGIEMYMALRRLGKKCWMLQYDNGSHIVVGQDAVDYTTRLTQFFDHYLKGALPPKWMTEGVPAARKGIDTGFELDGSGAQP